MVVNLPLMMPDPPRMGSRMTGALITLLSRTMANGLPTLFWVTEPNRRAPTASNRKLTTGRPLSMVGWESISMSPLMITRLRTR